MGGRSVVVPAVVLASAIVLGACSGSSKHVSELTTSTAAKAGKASAPQTSSPNASTSAKSKSAKSKLGGSTTARSSTTSVSTDSATVTVAAAGWQLPGALDREVVENDGKNLIVLGGRNAAKTSTATVLHLDPASGRSLDTGTLGAAVHDAAGAALGGSYFVFGGGNSTTVASVQRFSPGNGTRVIGQLPQSRSDLVAATFGDRVFIAGGYDGSRDVATVLATKDGVTFTAVGSLVQLVRYPAMGSADNALWVIGGETSTGDTNDIQKIDPATGAVTVAAHYPTTIAHEGVAVLGGHVYVIGGRVGGAVSDHVVELDPRTGTTHLVGHLPVPLSDMGVTVIGNTAYVVGGESAASSPTTGVTRVQRG